jgi:hypothetical protein
MLSITISSNDSLAIKLVNAFWLAAIFLDVFGAVLSTLTARWLELLDESEAEFLAESWTTTRLPRNMPTNCRKRFAEALIATALFSGMGVVAAGVTLFLLGLVIFVWERQPFLVSVIATIPIAVLAPLVASCFIPHAGEKRGIIEHLARRRGAW